MLRIDSFKSVANLYEVVLCDIWGVLHDGISFFERPVNALYQFRRGGGIVILITNSPRTSTGVVSQLDKIGVPPECYNAVVTSGDTTRYQVNKPELQPVYHIGSPADLELINELPVDLVSDITRAKSVLCTGLVNPKEEHVVDYIPLLQSILSQNLTMICANPDLEVLRGDKVEPCAGALAEMYKQLGGQVKYSGKPYKPIYELALNSANKIRGRATSQKKILAIGDSPRTDIAGAKANQIVSLLSLDTNFRRILVQNPNSSDPPEELITKLKDLNITSDAWTPELSW